MPSGEAVPDEAHEFRGVRLVAERLGVQEDGDHGLLDLPLRRERGQFVLRLPRERQLPFQQLFPLRAFPLGLLAGRHPGQFRKRRRRALGPRRREEHRRPDQRTRVPRRRFPQPDRQGAENPARPLEAVELGPAAVEDVGEVGVERIAGVEPLLLRPRVLLHPLVEPPEVAHGGDHVVPVAVGMRQVLGDEEAAAEHLGHVLLRHRLHALLLLPAEHVEEVPHQQLAFRVALLRRIGGEERRHQRRPVHPRDRLHEVLEEVLDAAPPGGAHPRLLAGVHEHLVHQDQGGASLRLRTRDQLRQQRLGGRSVAFFRLPLAVEGAESVVSGKLERQHAPRMPERPPLAARRGNVLDPPLHVNLVEAERGDEGAREFPTDGFPELPHRRQVGKRRGIAEEVVEGDERVGLPPAVGEFELPDRLVALPVEPVRHVLHQFPERMRREGQRKELRRILVHGPRPRSLRHLVEVGRELRQGQFPRLQFFLEAHHLPPRRRPASLSSRSPPHGSASSPEAYPLHRPGPARYGSATSYRESAGSLARRLPQRRRQLGAPVFTPARAAQQRTAPRRRTRWRFPSGPHPS